jgi:hypothetical protein
MTRRRITLQLDEDLVRLASVVAARQGITLGELVASYLENRLAAEGTYEEARRSAEEFLAESVPRGVKAWQRDDLYDRKGNCRRLNGPSTA